MSNTTESVDVDVDVTTAYNQWTQFESFPQFMDGVDEIRQLDDTHTHWKTSVGGTTREFDATITEQHPDDPEGPAETVADKTGIISRRVKGDMARFKQFIEAHGNETGQWRGNVEPGS